MHESIGASGIKLPDRIGSRMNKETGGRAPGGSPDGETVVVYICFICCLFCLLIVLCLLFCVSYCSMFVHLRAMLCRTLTPSPLKQTWGLLPAGLRGLGREISVSQNWLKGAEGVENMATL